MMPEILIRKSCLIMSVGLSILLAGCGSGSGSASTTSSTVVAAAVAPSPPARAALAVSYMPQLESQWCWAAVTQMVLAYNSNTVSQSQIASHEFGVNDNFPATAGQIQSDLKYFSDGTINAQISTGPLSFDQIVDKISHNIPIIVQYEYVADKTGHFAVIYGYDEGGNLLMDDPFYGQLTVPYRDANPYLPPGGEIMVWRFTIVG